jgi:hexokinase/glucose-6-phosphate 1-dehydrogenase
MQPNIKNIEFCAWENVSQIIQSRYVVPTTTTVSPTASSSTTTISPSNNNKPPTTSPTSTTSSFSSRLNLIFIFPANFPDLEKYVKEAKAIPAKISRVVIEPPFGTLETFSSLPFRTVTNIFGEDNTFFIDGKATSDVTRRLVALRFSNRLIEPSWNRNHIRAILIDCCEVSTTPIDLLNDMVVDHLLDLVALVAMERPATRFGADVRAAKNKVLETLRPITSNKCVFARHDGATSKKLATFATLVFEFDNKRWRNVPFIIRAGRGMSRTHTDIRVLYWPAVGSDRLWHDQTLSANELIIRVEPRDTASLDLCCNAPELATHLVGASALLAPVLSSTEARPYVPQAYERLLYEAAKGKLASFPTVSTLELCRRALATVSKPGDHAPQTSYALGSRTGPRASDELIASAVGRDCPWVTNSDTLPWIITSDPSAWKELEFSLHIGHTQMQSLVRKISDEITKGLAGQPSTIRCLPSFVTRLPNGDENGIYYALDIGGSNFRVARFIFHPDKEPQCTDEVHFKIPSQVYAKGSNADDLFGFLADCVYSIQGEKRGGESAVYGFTFSFPVDQFKLNSGRLLAWTKGFQTSGVVNKEVVGLLQNALQAKGLKGFVAAMVNDTVGTLATLAASDPTAKIGLILGTGTNAAYLEKIKRIPKLSVGPSTYQHNTVPGEQQDAGEFMVINTEWGNYGSGSPNSLPAWTEIDSAIDRESSNPNEQWLEKMVSGHTMGEVCRRLLVQLHERGEIWRHLWARSDASYALLDTPFSLSAIHVSTIEFDMSDELRLVAKIEESLGVTNSSLGDRKLVQKVCRAVCERAARIVACALTAIVLRLSDDLDDIPCSIAVDGSVYEHHPSFKSRLLSALDTLGCRCNLTLTKDGSGKGAALIAASMYEPKQLVRSAAMSGAGLELSQVGLTIDDVI